MIVIDANLLLYTYDSSALEHKNARARISALFEGDEVVGIPVQTVWAFLRIITHQNLVGKRFTMQQAIDVVDSWLEFPNVRILLPGERHWDLLRNLLLGGDARGSLSSDAALAAVTMEFGGVLETNDRDFSRYPGLRWRNPLQGT